MPQDIAGKFVSVGMCDQAVQAYKACGEMKEAIRACVQLNQVHTVCFLTTNPLEIDTRGPVEHSGRIGRETKVSGNWGDALTIREAAAGRGKSVCRY